MLSQKEHLEVLAGRVESQLNSARDQAKGLAQGQSEQTLSYLVEELISQPNLYHQAFGS